MRQVAGRFPRRSATSWSMAAITLRVAVAPWAGLARARISAASTVPAQVRKSLAVNSSPMYSPMYSFSLRAPRL